MSTDGQGIERRRNIAEIFNPLSRAYERYRRQTDKRRTDGRQHYSERERENKLRIIRSYVRSSYGLKAVLTSHNSIHINLLCTMKWLQKKQRQTEYNETYTHTTVNTIKV